MARDGESTAYEVFKGQNYRVLKLDDFENVVFGCPPDMVKDFGRRGEPLPSHYVIPTRTFIRGRNNFDFEFIIYSFLFEKTYREKIYVYCTRGQKERFLSILYETLFGPTFHQLLQAQCHSFIRRRKFNEKEQEKFDAFLKALGSDRKIYTLYKKNLKAHTSNSKLAAEIQAHVEGWIKKHRWLKGKKIPRLEKELTGHYIQCAQLKREVELFSLAEYKEKEKFLANVVHFIEFDRNHSVLISGNDRRKKLRIVQVRPSAFEVHLQNEEVTQIDISHLDPPAPMPDFELVEKPHVGVTFLGVGSGFTPKRRNSCLVVWSEGQGIMVDSLHESLRLALHHGISEHDLRYIFLSHVHSDHDTGLAEIMLSGQRIKIISTRIIFESFLRKMVAVTCFPIEQLEKFVDFVEVEPGKKMQLPGFERTWFTFDYSLHSIPAGRFQVTYQDAAGQETVISHSGDTKYDVEKINEWYEAGFFSQKRRDDILGFIWNADLIIHDIGGGTIHTKLKSLEHLDDSIVENMVLVHQHYDPDPNSRYKFASEGQTLPLIPQAPDGSGKDPGLLQKVSLFKELTDEDVLTVLTESEVVHYQVDEVVFSHEEPKDDFFVILDGFAEIVIDGLAYAFYEKGEFFGEVAASASVPKRPATLRAKSPLILLKIPSRLYKRYNFPKKQDPLSKTRSYFPDVMPPSLIASLAFGKIVRWSKDERILSEEVLPQETHIVLAGQVAIQKQGSGRAVLSGGDVLGEAGNGVAPVKTVTALAATDNVFTLRMNAAEMERVFTMYPSFQGTVHRKMKQLAEGLP